MAKSFSWYQGVGCGVWGVGCRVWGFTNFQGVNYLIFGEKVPDSNRWHFLISKKPKDIIQQGF
ncbi:MAG: hypothetical protein EWV40_07440 [Microcystis flos-aquae Mf_WU_F_19750830_S460]|uniref:Uncharacterized protein n=1 Tax=Microcystis flos-aquae Mf_WU_F_19750830_S460 TaxID=2486237 RepID=A0A552LV04_9CHRO|nr:MAG: hypothetical protein EWV40_07440 [Microcystis flos-aquae Mf_WU_F_19750830_S460]